MVLRSRSYWCTRSQLPQRAFGRLLLRHPTAKGAMDETDWLTECFEEHRSRLRGVAYRMLGSLSEADDAVQEARLRLARADPDSVEDLPAWLTTVVARVCLNMLRTREHRREQPLDE